MAYEGWLSLGGTEIANISRTVQLAREMGVSSVRVREEGVQWIEDELALPGEAYGVVEDAPWYDPNADASREFAGVLVLDAAGLDDSTLESSGVEYITDGGSVGRGRHAMLNIVLNVVLVAATEEGAAYGLRWLKQRLRESDFGQPSCVGPALRYFAHGQRESADPPPIVHRNGVKLSRGISVTRKRSTSCGVLVSATFTLVAADPFEYGEPQPQISLLGGVVTGPGLAASGTSVLTGQSCPVFDYSPVHDPLYPALVAPPPPPNVTPSGWVDRAGVGFKRYWARLDQVHPEQLSMVPVVTLSSASAARMIRVSLLPNDDAAAASYQCEAVWSAIVTYLPPGDDLIIDGENKVPYVWDGSNSRLATSLVLSPEARPMEWDSINGTVNTYAAGQGFFVALDLPEIDGAPGTYEGDGDVTAALSFVPKAD